MSKRFYLRPDQIKALAIDRGSCYATNIITVEGLKVGYMYREEPEHDEDSGWVFMAGSESQAYMDDAENLGIYDVNTIANYDEEIIPFLDAPFGSALVRDPESGEFEGAEFAPLDFPRALPADAFTADDPQARQTPESAITAEIPQSHEICDQCGGPIQTGKSAIRSKTETDIPGIFVHRSVLLTLCPICADEYDGTGNRMIWAMAAFVALVVTLGLLGWILA